MAAPQNRLPAGSGFLHLGQLTTLTFISSVAFCMGLPHWPQLATDAGFGVRQCSHITYRIVPFPGGPSVILGFSLLQWKPGVNPEGESRAG